MTQNDQRNGVWTAPADGKTTRSHFAVVCLHIKVSAIMPECQRRTRYQGLRLTYWLSESGFLGFLSRSHNFGLRVSRPCIVYIRVEWCVCFVLFLFLRVAGARCSTYRLLESGMLCQLLSVLRAAWLAEYQREKCYVSFCLAPLCEYIITLLERETLR